MFIISSRNDFIKKVFEYVVSSHFSNEVGCELYLRRKQYEMHELMRKTDS